MQGTGLHQTGVKRSVSSGLFGSPQVDPATSASGPQLPPLNFNGNQVQGPQLTPPLVRGVSSLSPISEDKSSGDPVVPKPTSNTTTPQDSANSSILGGHSVSNHPTPERNASTSSSLLGGGLQMSSPTPERGASANGTLSGGPLVSEPMPERKAPASPSGNFLGGRLASNATEKPHPALRTSRGSEDSSQGSRPDSKLAKSPSYASSGFEPDSKPQYDNTSPRVTSPVTSRSPISIQSFHSPPHSISLTSNIVPSTRGQSQGSKTPPVSGSRSHSPAPGPQSLHGLSQTSPPPEASQARQSPPPNRPTTPSPLATRHTPDKPDPPSKSDGTPIVSKWGSPQSPQMPDATQLVARSPVNNDLANEAGTYTLTCIMHIILNFVVQGRSTYYSSSLKRLHVQLGHGRLTKRKKKRMMIMILISLALNAILRHGEQHHRYSRPAPTVTLSGRRRIKSFLLPAGLLLAANLQAPEPSQPPVVTLTRVHPRSTSPHLFSRPFLLLYNQWCNLSSHRLAMMIMQMLWLLLLFLKTRRNLRHRRFYLLPLLKRMSPSRCNSRASPSIIHRPLHPLDKRLNARQKPRRSRKPATPPHICRESQTGM